MKKVIEYSSTRFYITQKVYEEIILNPEAKVIINVCPNDGKHPEGFYELSNNKARLFIASKQLFPNWKKHKNFKQDSVPSELASYFTYK